ncbi:hypothetical protein RYX36_005452 [Vicia faba]
MTTPYENMRLKRMAENKKKLEALNLPTLSQSLNKSSESYFKPSLVMPTFNYDSQIINNPSPDQNYNKFSTNPNHNNPSPDQNYNNFSANPNHNNPSPIKTTITSPPIQTTITPPPIKTTITHPPIQTAKDVVVEYEDEDVVEGDEAEDYVAGDEAEDVVVGDEAEDVVVGDEAEDVVKVAIFVYWDVKVIIVVYISYRNKYSPNAAIFAGHDPSFQVTVNSIKEHLLCEANRALRQRVTNIWTFFCLVKNSYECFLDSLVLFGILLALICCFERPIIYA